MSDDDYPQEEQDAEAIATFDLVAEIVAQLGWTDDESCAAAAALMNDPRLQIRRATDKA
jgi:hypothetical protein